MPVDPSAPQSTPQRAGGRSRATLAIGVLLVLTLVCLLGYGARAGWLSRGPATAAGAPSSTATATEAPVERREGLDTLLQKRAQALLTRDRAAWLSTVDARVPAVAEAQGRTFDNLGDLTFSHARLEYAGEGPALSAAQQQSLGPQAWVAKVVFSYRLTDADDADVRHEQHLTVVPATGGGWLVAGTSDGPASGAQLDMWDLAPVHTYRGQRSLVIGTTSEGLRDLADRVDTAAATVDSVWGTAWPRTVVIVAPGTQTELAQILGRADEDGLNQIAAVTTGEVGVDRGQASDRVIVNPATFNALDAQSAQVVLTHEVTHVATRAAGPGTVPLWFSEGFSDYVAYSAHTFTRHEVAGTTLNDIAAGGPLPALPTQDDFDPTKRESVDGAYATAYLAVDYLAQTYGREAVLQLYRAQAGSQGPGGAASTPLPLADALPATIGVDLATFQQQWQAYLRNLAAQPDS